MSTLPKLLLPLLVACADPEPPAPAVTPPKTGHEAVLDLSGSARGMNVLVISMDALRYDRTGGSGTGLGLTPNVDAFAKEAIVFHNTTSSASWTVPSHMSIWTGLWPSAHGVTNKLKPGTKQEDLVFQQLAPEIETFPERLVKDGWKAAAFTGGAGVSAKFGYGRGFDTYLDDKLFAGFDYSVDPALEWLGKNKDQRFFLFLHGYDVHGQHDLVDRRPREAVPDYTGALDGSIEEQARLREQGLASIVKAGDPARLDGLSPEDTRFLLAVYDAKVKEADARVGRFLDEFRKLGLMDTTVIAIVADHGEEFMEHGYIDHGPTLCQHQVHVPMMIRFPTAPNTRDVRANVRTIDLFPTIFDTLGQPGPQNVSGRSLLPLIRGEKLELPVYAESDYRLFVHQRMTRVDTRKLILDLEDGQKSLYDLATDPQELTDLGTTDARTTYEFEQGLRTWMAESKTDPKDYLGVKQEHIKLF